LFSGYALLRLPKIPETRGIRGQKIVFETAAVNTGLIPYLHKEKEEARQRKLAKIAQKKAEEKVCQCAMAGLVRSSY
jgi:hypothetical protein